MCTWILFVLEPNYADVSFVAFSKRLGTILCILDNSNICRTAQLAFDSDHAPWLQQAKQKIVLVDFTHAVAPKNGFLF